MIYITLQTQEYEDTTIEKVWFVKEDNVEELYKVFMLAEAGKLGLVVNPHWLNAMNYKDHNSILSKYDYKQKCNEWIKTLNQFSIEWFIKEKLEGTEIEFKTLYL